MFSILPSAREEDVFGTIDTFIHPKSREIGTQNRHIIPTENTDKLCVQHGNMVADGLASLVVKKHGTTGLVVAVVSCV